MKNIIIKDEKYLDLRIDKFLFNYLEGKHTRTFIQNLINEGIISVNKKLIKNGYKLKLNDEVQVGEIIIKSLDIEKQNIPIDILYEDKDLIIVNKSKGMIVHPAPNVYSNTLVNALLYHCKDLSSINGVKRPGIVHRIDKDTSGILVVAKNDISHNFLAKQFKEHSIRREYVCLINGCMKNISGRISYNISRHPKDRIKMAVVPEGKRAITDYVVIKKYNKYSLVLCKLHTGRTHQIRVHMSHIGFPIVGDLVYGTKNKSIYKDGQLLHARIIGFIHPTTKKYLEFKAPLPTYFKNIISNL